MKSYKTFEAMPLAAPIHRALQEKRYHTPSPIQSQAIPLLLDGHDILASAQTGTGKTAAFALPILHRLHKQKRSLKPYGMRALVLTPTRELAAQVAKNFSEYGHHMPFNCVQVYGGVNQNKQVNALKQGTDAVVATPGRLLDLYEQGLIDFGNIEFFVLDEVDRMLDMGFINDIRKIIKELPPKRQSLFFSATLTPKITQLAGSILTKPKNISITPNQNTAEKIDHRICYLDTKNKKELLNSLVKEQKQQEGQQLTLVFSRTKHGAEKVVRLLKRTGVRSEAIHGNRTQSARQRALENFRNGRTDVLVATDVAARGIDIKNVTLVINYDLPDDPENYVHRIGRTARGGAEGRALSFCTADNKKELTSIERFIKQSIPVEANHAFHVETVVEQQQAIPGKRSNKLTSEKLKGNRGRRRRKPSNHKRLPSASSVES